MLIISNLQLDGNSWQHYNTATHNVSSFKLHRSEKNQENCQGKGLAVYEVGKDYVDILTPDIMNIWNFPLSTQSWPWSWKETDINSLLKVYLKF